ncbi:IS701 family transposase [Verrucomicrobiota bacterium sgz303538]
MNRRMLDLYTDYLLASGGGQVTATGLSALLGGKVSHDAVTRFLAGDGEPPSPKEWWFLVKPVIRQVESEEGILIVDDTLEEKPYSEESPIICWHFDHTKGRNIKGINLLTLLYSARVGPQEEDLLSVPLSFRLIEKTEWETRTDAQGREQYRRVSAKTKNELLREMLLQARANQVRYRFVVADSWFSSKENMVLIKCELGKDFVMPLKSNRRVALSLKDKRNGCWREVDTVDCAEGTTREVWLEGVDFPLLMARQVFRNKDGTEAVLYLVTSDTTLSFEQITGIYQRRWKFEEYHKSIKQNAGMAKSPAHTEATQSRHLLCCLYAFIKLERLKLTSGLNHFALKSRLYMEGLSRALKALHSLRPIPLNKLAPA